jgi:hypothetical protein
MLKKSMKKDHENLLFTKYYRIFTELELLKVKIWDANLEQST